MCSKKVTNEVTEGIAARFREEVERLPEGVSGVARAVSKARNTVYNWMDKGNIPADDLVRLKEIGIDPVYVMTGLHHVSASATGETPAQYGEQLRAVRSNNVRNSDGTVHTDLMIILDVIRYLDDSHLHELARRAEEVCADQLVKNIEADLGIDSDSSHDHGVKKTAK